MKSCRRFIQNIDCTPCTAFAQFCCQLDTLCFTTGQLCRRLSQADIRKSHIIKCFDLPAYGGNILKKLHGFFYSHVQYIVDIFVFVFYFQCFSVVTFTLADFTWNIYISQEVHLDLDDPVSAAGLTSAALYIKAESALLVASCLGISRRCKKIPDLIKHASVSSRVGSGGTSNRRLINIDHLVQLLQSLNGFMFSWYGSCPVQISGKCLVKDFVDQRAFAGTADTGNTGHHSKRDIHIYLLQIVLCSTFDLQPSSGLLSLFWNRNLTSAA